MTMNVMIRSNSAHTRFRNVGWQKKSNWPATNCYVETEQSYLGTCQAHLRNTRPPHVSTPNWLSRITEPVECKRMGKTKEAEAQFLAFQRISKRAWSELSQ